MMLRRRRALDDVSGSNSFGPFGHGTSKGKKLGELMDECFSEIGQAKVGRERRRTRTLICRRAIGGKGQCISAEVVSDADQAAGLLDLLSRRQSS